ncbi:hypothetical protein ALC60_06808 [Trachymyrmex zeteki]|uniref:Uncharacterized protein n=1 Tax=Mycetomoellerius zeteki TaxID=64791 RepID=A0A151X253_9HYME|nr:hypothetical protein ALC60_06808 [Trachymyrmex zeteki]
MSSTHFFGAVLQGTPRTPVGGERLDKHGALSDGPSAVLSWQRRGRKRSRGGRDVRDRKALAKRKVVHQTDEPVDAQMRFNVSPRLHV